MHICRDRNHIIICQFLDKIRFGVEYTLQRIAFLDHYSLLGQINTQQPFVSEQTPMDKYYNEFYPTEFSDGDLVFPPHLHHSVKVGSANKSEQRLTFSFNISHNDEAYSILELFPTPVIKFKFDKHDEYVNKWDNWEQCGRHKAWQCELNTSFPQVQQDDPYAPMDIVNKLKDDLQIRLRKCISLRD